MRIAAPEVQLALNRGEKYFTCSSCALLYALASALPLGFVVVRRYRFLSGCWLLSWNLNYEQPGGRMSVASRDG